MKERESGSSTGWDTGMGYPDTMNRDGKQDVGETTLTAQKTQDDRRMTGEMTAPVSYTPGSFHLSPAASPRLQPRHVGP